MSKPGAKHLYEMLERNHAFAQRTVQPGFPLQEFNNLQHWQCDRLARSFEDLNSQGAYRPAIEFFLTDIYGGLDFRERDQDMGRVMPVMVRFLPDRALDTLAEAFELQAVSLEFDERMADYMRQEGLLQLDMDIYGVVYRAGSDRAGRERQIRLIRKLGHDLDQLVNKPVVNYLVRLLRGPAHAAGFGKLQEFLETGLVAFRALADARAFVDTIFEREWQAMRRLFDGEPDPFLLQGKVQSKCSAR